MRCRNCGTEIADKAIVCYRCGTATREAKYKPAAPRRQSRSGMLVTALALALLVLLALYMGRLPGAQTPRLATWIAVGVAVLIVAARAYARRR
jgi:multisubunit Na+/H+ antiporter MnhB subunit